MNASAILEQIQTDARNTASQLLSDAKAKSAALHAASEQRIRADEQRVRSEAKQEAQAARGRMERMAQLEERKRLLADKRQVMDEAFQAALRQMEAMPAAQAQAYLVRTVAAIADGDETIVPGADHAAWLDEGFLPALREALAAAGKPARVTLSDEKAEGLSGLKLLKGETEVNCSYQALLDSQRMALEAEVAAALFPEEA